MTVQRMDIFHCVACGRVDYQPHGAAAPACCSEPMVRAVADVVKEVPERGFAAADAEEHALLAEAVEILNWCRAVPDASRYEELARRVDGLREALRDQFENQVQSVNGIVDPGRKSLINQLRNEQQRLLGTLTRLVNDLRHGASRFRGWDDVCERLEWLTSDMRRHGETEDELARTAIHEDSSRRN